MDRPITSWPASARSAAATDESTPPDMATTTLIVCRSFQRRDRQDAKGYFRSVCFASSRLCVETSTRAHGGEASQLRHDSRQDRNDVIDLCLGVAGAQAEADGVLRAMARQVHRFQHVGWFERTRG